MVIDEKGRVIFLKVYELGELPDIREVVDLLKTL